MNEHTHDWWMRQAYRYALVAKGNDEIPIGAVVVHDEMLVGSGYNQTISNQDPTAHAEIIALREAARTLGNYRLNDVSLYVTVEPCLMCAGAMIHARIGTLIYGTPEPRTGAVRSVICTLNHPSFNHRVSIVSGVLERESRTLMQEFFQNRRPVVVP